MLNADDLVVDLIEWSIPSGIRLAEGPKGLRLLGESGDLLDAFDELRFLLCGSGPRETLDDRAGTAVRAGDWDLYVKGDLTVVPNPHRVSYSGKEWATAMSICRDVACGRILSPADFHQVGLAPAHIPDIGVSVTGVTRYDWAFPNYPEINVPEAWTGVRKNLDAKGQTVLLRHTSLRAWEARQVDLASGEISKLPIETAATLEALVDLLN